MFIISTYSMFIIIISLRIATDTNNEIQDFNLNENEYSDQEFSRRFKVISSTLDTSAEFARINDISSKYNINTWR